MLVGNSELSQLFWNEVNMFAKSIATVGLKMSSVAV
jgi:hypothetical protein